jgi:uncharacterized protein YoxC
MLEGGNRMTKKELYEKINQLFNDTVDLKEELDTVVRGLNDLERTIEELPGEDNPLEDEKE